MNTRTRFSLLGLLAISIIASVPLRAQMVPLHHWQMNDAAFAGRTLEAVIGPNAVVLKEPETEDGALMLDGESRIDVIGVTATHLPTKFLTVEATIAIDQGQKWGNVIGYFQDNGSYERGWALGYNEKHFTFWLSTGGTMVMLSSKTEYKKGDFYHVAATYDGVEMNLYVNGKLDASGSTASGAIVYPEKAFYTIGAYRDDDEHYPMFGKIRDVRVFDTIVPAAEFSARSAKLKNKSGSRTLEFAVRPYLKFTSPTTAKIAWETSTAGPGAVNFGLTRKLGKIVPAQSAESGTEVTLSGLLPNSHYFYKLASMQSGKRIMSRTYEFNTSMNYTMAPLPEAATDSPLASQVLAQSAVQKGYAVLLEEMGHLASSIAASTELSVFVFDTDPNRITAMRKQLLKDGTYGHRISVSHVDDCENLPVTSCFANLVVAPERLRSSEIDRILSPGTGRACFVNGRSELTQTISRPALEGTGQWTHQYGDAGNSTNAGESLGGASSTDDLTLQWIGRPGGDFGIDRQSRMPAPLAAGGRLYHQGMSRLIALDAYNGSVLWGMEIPDLRRLNMPRDCSNWCADTDRLFVAVEERAWILDGVTGERLSTLQPAPLRSGERLNWGYIARHNDKLYGSNTKANSVYTRYWGGEAWFDEKEGEGTGKVSSDNFFAYNLQDGSIAWSYENGVIINPTIALGGGKVVFVECRNPAVKAAEERQVSVKELWQDQFLVALDAATGKILWESPIDTVDGVTSFYLQYNPKGIVITASNKQFYIYNFNPENGELQWETANAWPDDHHSGHIQHPVIVGDTLYLQPNGYSMITGETVTTNVGKRSGCTTYIGVRDALIYRGSERQVSMWDLKTEKVSAWDRLRPSCWLSVIAAEGMVLVPEGGGGCSCGGWMETSLVLAPRSLVTGKEAAQ
ncbi:MAG: outer membrane protein assembly factor BamB [Verrucomicrobiales bacterium]|jgi:outer membrane protein assembly factor BamB